MTEESIVVCPHCNQLIIIEKINCAIFRHGIFKESGNQIDPHASKDLCEYYIKTNIIYGCGKPFRIILSNNQLQTEICDYI
jgi:hypothetical protein